MVTKSTIMGVIVAAVVTSFVPGLGLPPLIVGGVTFVGTFAITCFIASRYIFHEQRASEK